MLTHTLSVYGSVHDCTESSVFLNHSKTTRGNYIPEKRKFPGILCFRQQRRVRRHVRRRVRRSVRRRVTISWSAKDLSYILLNLTCIIHPNISDEFDNWHCRPIQNGRRRPFCQKKKKKKVACRSQMARNAIKS